MFALIYGLVKYVLEYKNSVKCDIEDLNEIIDRIENIYDKDTTKTLEEISSEKEDIPYKTGTITSIALNYLLIDNSYVCNTSDVRVENLKIGDQVRYISIKNEIDEKQDVWKILSTIDQRSDDSIARTQPDDVRRYTLSKQVIGQIKINKCRKIFIVPQNIFVDLNTIKLEFVPMVGDWLLLEAMIKVNENFTELNEEILTVNSIRPLRSKLDIGLISSYDPITKSGTIGENIIFYKQVCDPGYIPSIGDRVLSDNVESDQGPYTWRSVTVTPVMQVSGRYMKLPVSCTPQLSKDELEELIQNKFDIVITDNLSFNMDIEDEKEMTVFIRNTGNIEHVLCKGSFATNKTQSQLSLVWPKTTDTTMVLQPLETISYIFKCKPKSVGSTKELFTFYFQNFQIGRIFLITVNAKNTQHKTRHKYRNNKKKRTGYIPNEYDLDERLYIPGIRPYKPPAFVKMRNDIFKVPKHYWEIVLTTLGQNMSQYECEIIIQNAIPCLSKKLSIETYKDRFHALLHLEEIAQTMSMQQYDTHSVILRRSGEYLAMEVPGLVEKRPSLIIGDKAIVSYMWPGSEGKIKYEGYIHKVTNTEVFLKFNEKFHQDYKQTILEVTFKTSYSSLQRCHNTINMVVTRLGSNFLFPSKVIQKEAQLYINENENTELVCGQIADKKMSLSPVCSLTNSTHIISDSQNHKVKSTPRMSVAERLFKVKPIVKHAKAIENHRLRNGIHVLNNSDLENNTTCHDYIQDSLSLKKSNSINDHERSELEPLFYKLKKRKLIWFNRDLNYYQKEAVRNILKGLARPLPYVIFGPPGTGKTVTLCEAVLQILLLLPDSRLLIATPSNSSANLISERLLDSKMLKPGDLVRLIAHHCLGSDSIPDKLLPYCATAELATQGTTQKREYSGKGPRTNCTFSVLGRHRITVGTCTAVGILHNMNFPYGHFSHVLIDEAGQATEPEIMVPLSLIHPDYGQVVLAGDPLQLGPVIQSRFTKSFGLDESYLTRLLRQFPYQRDSVGFKTQYDPRLITKLVMNYRSLPEILELPNSMFYDNELQPQISSSDSKEAELLCTLAPELFHKEGVPFPIIFHGINGENCKDIDSPSWYNVEEATQAYLYLSKLYKYGLSANDIGIITPYQKQVHQIQDLLLEMDMELPKISSVEGFQGQERNIIILSTVRSSSNFVDEDKKHSLGFVASPQRLNVAITRARALLIIIGNPILLAQDPYWKSVLTYCTDRSAYTGCTYFPS